MFESPQLRPGALPPGPLVARLLAYFPDAAMGNSAVQLLIGLGVPSDRLAVTPSERMPEGQGMLLALDCPTPLLIRVESACRRLGGAVHRAPYSSDEGSLGQPRSMTGLV